MTRSGVLCASPTRTSVGCERRRLEHQFLVAARTEGNRYMRDGMSITGLIIDVT
jgi:hypothetical protein